MKAQQKTINKRDITLFQLQQFKLEQFKIQKILDEEWDAMIKTFSKEINLVNLIDDMKEQK